MGTLSTRLQSYLHAAYTDLLKEQKHASTGEFATHIAIEHKKKVGRGITVVYTKRGVNGFAS